MVLNNSAVKWSAHQTVSGILSDNFDYLVDNCRILWNSSRISIRILKQNLMANSSDDCGILMEFFKNFDQNSDGKIQMTGEFQWNYLRILIRKSSASAP